MKLQPPEMCVACGCERLVPTFKKKEAGRMLFSRRAAVWSAENNLGAAAHPIQMTTQRNHFALPRPLGDSLRRKQLIVFIKFIHSTLRPFHSLAR